MEIKTIQVGDLKTNCFIVTADSGDTFLVDPGADFEKIKSELRLIPKLNLVYILLTHAHYDHVGALDELKKEFPKADVIISEHDIEMLRNVPAQGIYVGEILTSVKSEVMAIKNGDTLPFSGLQIKVIGTPGHSRGGLCYLFEDVIFTGDTLFYHTYGRTDLPESEPEVMEKSLKEILKLPGETFVYPGHGRSTSIGEESNFWKIGHNSFS